MHLNTRWIGLAFADFAGLHRLVKTPGVGDPGRILEHHGQACHPDESPGVVMCDRADKDVFADG